MLEKVIENREPIASVLADRQITTPKFAIEHQIQEEEWLLMEKIKNILSTGRDLTTLFCQDSCSGPMVRPSIRCWIKNKLQSDPGDCFIIKELKKYLSDGLEKSIFNEIEENARMVATFFDPRYKDLKYEKPAVKEKIILHAKEMFNEIPCTAIDEESPPPQKRTKYIKMIQNIFSNNQPDENYKDKQWREYIQAPIASLEENSLDWWKIHEKRFPDIAKIAKYFLAIPASSASSERVFSTAGNIVTNKRTCLKPNHVNMLVFLSQNSMYLKK